jgi:hypothetical protein
MADAYIVYSVFYAPSFTAGSWDAYIQVIIGAFSFLWSVSIMSAFSASAWDYGNKYWVSAGLPEQGQVSSWLTTIAQVLGILPSTMVLIKLYTYKYLVKWSTGHPRILQPELSQFLLVTANVAQG